MGKTFFDNYAQVREIFEEASDVLKKNMARLVFESDEKELMRTENCQEALFVVSYSIFEVVKKLFPEIQLQGAAGLSLGEYTALAAVGAAEFSDLLRLVTLRGAFMDEACEKRPGAMAALLGFSKEEAENFCAASKGGGEELFIANYNAPGQIVASGSVRAIEKLKENLAATKDRTKKLVPLGGVHGAFHTPFMKEAEKKLSPYIEATSFSLPDIPFVMNVSAASPKNVEEMKDLLKAQVSHSVRWEESIRELEKRPPSFYLQCGPGKTLVSFNKRIGVRAETLSLEKVEELSALESRIYGTAS